MRIALRTSGGRGEYELAGTHENIRVHDVFDHQLVLQILPGQKIYTHNYVRHTQGKPRIRLREQRLDKHIYLILAAILLLPKPKREIGITPAGKLQIYKDNFSVLSIPFDVVELTSTELVISPTHIILSNSSEDTVRLDVIERMSLVMSAWEAASNSPITPISNLLIQHKNAFNTVNVKNMLDTCEAIRLINTELDDPLRYTAKYLNFPNTVEFAWRGIYTTEIDEALALGEENLEDFREAARNRVKTWRLLAARGASGTKFSNDVKLAYNNTCLFTGFRLPKTYLTGPAGVDAAHILPWAEYGLNRVSNGLCLSKLCHWAFDAGIIILDFNPISNRYCLSISKKALHAESQGLIDLAPFHSIQGTVSNSLLPKDKANWPDISFLKVFNETSNF
ncbi:MAG: HNH endonuclease [Azoarcus sp.]|jgi:hypothetical protein|nr:HNH endonuclease [Azoarcus sp.]